MKKVVILGTNNYTHIFEDYLRQDEKYQVVGYTVDRKYIRGDKWNELPLVPFEEIQDFFSPKHYCILNAIGYSNMNEGRKKKFEECKEKGYEIITYVHPSAVVLTRDIGEGNLIMAGAVIERGCRLGKGNIINPNVLISHDTSLGDFNFIAGATAIAGNTTVGNNCMLGLNSTIRHEVFVADYTLVGAGAYINFDTEEGSVYVPARTIKLEQKDSKQMQI